VLANGRDSFFPAWPDVVPINAFSPELRAADVGMAATAIVLVFFAVEVVCNAAETFVAIVAIALLAVILDVVWKRSGGPETSPQELRPSPVRNVCRWSSLSSAIGR
jgi:hypothetical protein